MEYTQRVAVPCATKREVNILQASDDVETSAMDCAVLRPNNEYLSDQARKNCNYDASSCPSCKEVDSSNNWPRSCSSNHLYTNKRASKPSKDPCCLNISR